jgi:hypothetical protein
MAGGAVLAVGLMLGMTGTAFAGTEGGATAHPDGAFGSANWNWSGTALTSVNLAVRDEVCDGNKVYVYVQTYTRSGGSVNHAKYWNDRCKTTKYWYDQRFDRADIIRVASVHVCVQLENETDRCDHDDDVPDAGEQ